MTLLHEVCTLCVSLDFVEHTLALCYYFVHYGFKLVGSSCAHTFRGMSLCYVLYLWVVG